jgi:hypothetical protein
LKEEVESTVTTMKRDHQNLQKSIPQYLFTALSSIVQGGFVKENANSSPPWVLSILRLPIFPILTEDGTVTITNLTADIFIPDSELLNERFKGKVKLLYFGDNHIRDILPIIRCSDVDLQYVSSYDDPTTMDVKIERPITGHVSISKILFDRREALTR